MATDHPSQTPTSHRRSRAPRAGGGSEGMNGGRATRSPQPWRGHITVMPEYKPGDLPPEGYLQWHEWADVQRKAGIKQIQCPSCSKWLTSQELSTHEVRWSGMDRRGNTINRSAFQCSGCFERAAAKFLEGEADGE